MFADSPVCSLRYPHEGPLARAFGVLDPGGRTRTGTTRMDSPVLYQLSYPGSYRRSCRPVVISKALFETRPRRSECFRLGHSSAMTRERAGVRGGYLQSGYGCLLSSTRAGMPRRCVGSLPAT
jgi:hypothetical protein